MYPRYTISFYIFGFVFFFVIKNYKLRLAKRSASQYCRPLSIPPSSLLHLAHASEVTVPRHTRDTRMEFYCCSLCWQLKLFAFEHFGNVKIKEIAVKNGLNDAGKNRDQIVVRLNHVTVHPIEQI